jgi:hypothetical protein
MLLHVAKNIYTQFKTHKEEAAYKKAGTAEREGLGGYSPPQ